TDQVLLLSGRTSQRYWFPGGGVDAGASLEATLHRELLEEAGISVRIITFLSFKEEFFYHNVWKKAFHSLRFYYLCEPITFHLIPDDEVLDGESEKPRWIPINALTEDLFDQDYGLEIVHRGLSYFNTQNER